MKGVNEKMFKIIEKFIPAKNDNNVTKQRANWTKMPATPLKKMPAKLK